LATKALIDGLVPGLISNGALLLATAAAVTAIMLAEYRTTAGRRQPGGFGLRPVADLIKLASKRLPDIKSSSAWSPPLLLATSFTALAVIPFCQSSPDAPSWTALAAWGGSTSQGVIFVMVLGFVALQSGLIAGARSPVGELGGFGGMRLVARQLSSYLALGIAVLGVIAKSGTARFDDVISVQVETAGHAIPAWNVFAQPMGFAVCVIALMQLAPWRPLTQRGLARGGRLDSLYSGRHLALLMVAERVHLIAVSAFVVALYLGGWHLPGLVEGGSAKPLAQTIAMAIKTAVVVLLFLWARTRVPSLVLERAATVGWKYLLPLAFANLLMTTISAYLSTVGV